MTREERIEHLISSIPSLSDFRLGLLDDIITVLEHPCDFSRNSNSDILSDKVLTDFGDILRVHHSFSREPFSKDKFEYALEKVLKHSDISATLASRGQRGYDITIRSQQFSLKTEAAKAIKVDTLHISKFMELGGGSWGDDPGDLPGRLQQFLSTLSSVERILTLRALEKSNPYRYELVEIPKDLLEKSKSGRLEMMSESTQSPKPGYCYVEDSGELLFSLYFDGGGERKLQVKSLNKALCTVHGEWNFSLPTHTQ